MEYCFHCDVIAKEDKQVSDEMSLLIKNREVDELLSAFKEKSLMNVDLEQATFENYKPQSETQQAALKQSQEYVESFDSRKRLLLQGKPGIGKSHLAASIVKELIKQKHTGIFISVPRLMTELKATYNRNSTVTEIELLTALQKVDLLVMDDLGIDREGLTDKAATWAKGKVYEIIDSRVGKSTVYTTNFTGKELMHMYGERDFSRMFQDCKAVKMDGKNYRLKDFM
ncbi:ATP-binding protein [Mesobacillus zeae]|uniref:ATP-binding protein n=1 Tax=Mesobacillus zeae TaxID=1917180 RepID=UPI0015E6E21E|nr:ATP-binding protein [Mesobacillus zeae]